MNKNKRNGLKAKKQISLFVFLICFCLSIANSSAITTETLWSLSSFGEDSYFYQPSDIEEDLKQSLIYVEDSGNNCVFVFNFKGKFLKTIGRKGQGPGEFAQPTGLYVSADSMLVVADFGNNRIQVFNDSGDFIRSIKPRKVRVADLIFIDENIYTIPSFGMSGYSLDMGSKENTQPLVNIIDKDGNLLNKIETHDFPANQPFLRALNNRVCLTLSKDEKLFLPYFSKNLIQKFDLNGTKLTQFEISLPFKPIIPKVQQQTSKDGIIRMMASMDMVTQDAKIGTDGQLYLLRFSQSYNQQGKKIENHKDPPPIAKQIDVINTTSHKLIYTIECDPGTRTFTLLGKNRVAYIYKDSEGELFLKCCRVLPELRSLPENRSFIRLKLY